MRLLNPVDRYGLLSIALHWGIALAVFGAFGIGLWMGELGYFHPWFHRAPDLHQALGLVVGVLWLLRSAARLLQHKPPPLPQTSRLQQALALLAHAAMEFLVLLVLLSGYLMSTADGHPLQVFGVAVLPALGQLGLPPDDFAGLLHQWLAWVLVLVAALHTMAAFKHHLIDRDCTLRRMLGRRLRRDNWPRPNPGGHPLDPPSPLT